MKFEKKFLYLSFFIFFILQLIFITIINNYSYKEYKYFIKDEIKKQLEICSYKLNCKDINTSFEAKKSTPFKLVETNSSFYMLFDLPYLKKYYLKLSIDKKYYDKKLNKIKSQLIQKFIIEFIVILILSVIFTMFLFVPLKEAYKINENFIKDILHDFNTPLSTLKLNLYLLSKEIGENERIKKLNQNIKTILNYQKNLKTFLSNNPNQKESFNIKDIIDEKLKFYSQNYPYIKYKNSANLTISTNKQAFESIIDNLISNAFKYNKKDGSINIYTKNNKLFIEDSGKGIKNPNKVFDRFYKENERGIGIGMSIVKKLADELKIDIKIDTILNKGSTFILDLTKLTLS